MTMEVDRRLARVFGPTGATTEQEASRKSRVKFVRGRAQLSRLETGMRARQGHVISAREAYDNYGFEVLAEAVEHGAALLLKEPNAAGHSIRRQRDSLGLTLDQVARHTGVDVATMKHIEDCSGRDRVRVQELERVAFKLGLDEAQIAFQGIAEDAAIAARLKQMGMGSSTAATKLSARSVLTFAEAASVIRVQHRLMQRLGVESTQRAKFVPDGYYGTSQNPAWKVGQELSERARDVLDLGRRPVKSMRALVEDTLCIPVIHVELAQRAIAGATISVTDGDETWRGIVLNLLGDNENPLVRRATIAHEIAHLLYDPDEYLNKVTVDTYEGLAYNPKNGTDFADNNESYYVEQRANAFAISFLAPIEEVHDMAKPPFLGDDVSQVVSTYGVSVTAASYHVVNASYQDVEPPHHVPYDNGEEWKGVENFAVDYFRIHSTPITRRGRFARLVVEACNEGLISTETAAEYLCCSAADYQSHAHQIA